MLGRGGGGGGEDELWELNKVQRAGNVRCLVEFLCDYCTNEEVTFLLHKARLGYALSDRHVLLTQNVTWFIQTDKSNLKNPQIMICISYLRPISCLIIDTTDQCISIRHYIEEQCWSWVPFELRAFRSGELNCIFIWGAHGSPFDYMFHGGCTMYSKWLIVVPLKPLLLICKLIKYSKVYNNHCTS